MNETEGADCIALFDVDSRPNANFLTKCVRKFTGTSDPDYAQWRLSTFEVYWKQSIDGMQRIRDLLYGGFFLL